MRWVADAAVVAAQAAVFVPLALWRFLDPDEGYYSLAARRVVHGELPYRDFFFPQMPLTPYLYGAWFSVVDTSWYAGRLLSALIAIALGALLYFHLARRHGRTAAAVGVAIYCCSSLVFGWFSTVKALGLATLALFAAYVLVEHVATRRALEWAGIGFLVALAVDTRLMYAATIPAFVWAALRVGSGRARRLSLLAAGTTAGDSCSTTSAITRTAAPPVSSGTSVRSSSSAETSSGSGRPTVRSARAPTGPSSSSSSCSR
jgi:hypothetical protein